MVGKDWWESVVILTTKDDSLNHSDIDYLESVLIEKAQKINRLDCDNKNKGNNPKVDKFRKVYLGQYLDEALFLMQLIGISVFAENGKFNKGTLIPTLDTKTKLAIGKRAKNDAIEYLTAKGIELGKKPSYGVKQPEKDEYWLNPQTYLLEKEWFVILNNNATMELTILKIPANSLCLKTDNTKGLLVRLDKPTLIDLNLNTATLIDRKSGVDFSGFVVNKVKY